ncbi:hypothetical protein HPB50_013263 [Hyalomma asiaticum]|uniref:Uncharacterized protein n=1 Tax=Hyalomma asiaticum TaxID=266040 RepID=A0ACB7TAE2_HYAAI|nr:hypothetical protein HPB50_013263 [Hyalomma asiaticum]
MKPKSSDVVSPVRGSRHSGRLARELEAEVTQGLPEKRRSRSTLGAGHSSEIVKRGPSPGKRSSGVSLGRPHTSVISLRSVGDRSRSRPRCSQLSFETLKKKKKNAWQPPPPRSPLEAMRDFSSSPGSPMTSTSGGAVSPSIPSSSATQAITAQTRLLAVTGTIAVAVVVVAAILAALVLLLALSEVTTTSRDVCTTDACYEYSKRLRESLNLSVHPCVDFTRFVCDGWRRTHDSSVAEAAFLSTFERMSRFVRALDVPARGQSAVERAAAFYRSCEYVLLGTRNEEHRVKSVLAAAGINWPYVTTAPDVLHTFLYVHLILRWNVVFKVDSLRSRQDGSVVLVLRASLDEAPGIKQLELMEPYEARAYFDTLVAAFADNENEGGELVSFEETNAVEKAAIGTLVRGLYNTTSRVRTVSPTVLFETVPNLTRARWRSTLASVGVPEDTHLVTTHPLYVALFFSLWLYWRESLLHLFLSWYTVQMAALYASRRLIKNFYGSEESAMLKHSAFCFSKAYLLSGSAAFTTYTDYMLIGDTRKQAEELLWNVRAAFLKFLQRWPTNDNSSTAAMLAVHEDDFLASSFAVLDNQTDDDPRSTPGGSDVPVDMTDSLVDNWLAAALPRSNTLSSVAAAAIQRLSFTAVTDDGAIVLLPYIFSFPFFDTNGNPALNFGGVGALFANELAQLSLVRYVTSGEGSMLEFLNCTGARLDGGDTTRVLGAFYALATSPLFEVFTSASTEASRLPELQIITAEQLFFVSLCYAKCHGDRADVILEPECGEYLPHVEAFSQAFHCQIGSPMRPAVKCHVY